MSGQGEEAGRSEARPMSREEWLEFYADQAPEITEEQWQETVHIVEMARRRRRTSDCVPPAQGKQPLTGAARVGGRGMEPPAT